MEALNCCRIERRYSLAPEFIRPQDGATKQDSETAAAKRWLKTYGSAFDGLNITVLGDDLYSRQPMVESCLYHVVLNTHN